MNECFGQRDPPFHERRQLLLMAVAPTRHVRIGPGGLSIACLNYFRYAGLMAVQTYPYSAFLRGPSKVLPSLDDADVILERRDEENLVLIRAERFDAVTTGLRIAARSLAILARRHRNLAEEALAEELPWLAWLPVDERPACVAELLSDLLAGADTGLLLPFVRNLASWRSTAEAWSDPHLAHDLQGPFAGDGPALDRPSQDAA
jgi:hypothetical protein